MMVRKNTSAPDDPKKVQKIINAIYDRVINGIPYVSEPIEKLVQDYLGKEPDREKAAKKMIKNQKTKCATAGFITGLGGVITLPLVVPVDVSSVWYMQLRMTAAVAYMAGYDVRSDQVKTFVLACTAGVAIANELKEVGIRIATKLTAKQIAKIPGRILIKINQAVGFRLITKAGAKGVINLTKMLPLVGGVIGGGIDYATTEIVAKRAIKNFFDGDFSDGEEIIDVDAE